LRRGLAKEEKLSRRFYLIAEELEEMKERTGSFAQIMKRWSWCSDSRCVVIDLV
jgi:hypothetical protein